MRDRKIPFHFIAEFGWEDLQFYLKALETGSDRRDGCAVLVLVVILSLWCSHTQRANSDQVEGPRNFLPTPQMKLVGT